MEWESKLRAVLDAVSALEALAFNAERIAVQDANCGRVDAAPPPGTLAEQHEWTKAIADGNARTRCELRERLLSTGGDRTLTEAREWCERLAEAVAGFGRVDLAKAAPEIMRAWEAFDHALRKSTPGIVFALDAERIRTATDAARDAVETMNAEAVAGVSKHDASDEPTRPGSWFFHASGERITADALRKAAERAERDGRDYPKRKKLNPDTDREWLYEVSSVIRYKPELRWFIEAALKSEISETR